MLVDPILHPGKKRYWRARQIKDKEELEGEKKGEEEYKAGSGKNVG